MDPIIRHLPREQALTLGAQVDYLPGQVVSKTLVQNPAVGLTLFAFDKGEQISTHEAGGDALVTVLEGTGRLVINGADHVLGAGESIVMPAGAPHSVHAPEAFKMALTVVYPTA